MTATTVRAASAALLLALLALAGPPAAAQSDVPYWASIRAGIAKMRAGPGRQFPSTWVYRRVDLPLRVIQRHDDWRKVEDPDGTTGWMLRTLLTDRRTAIVRTLTTVHAEPSGASHVNWRVEPGVVGRLDDCDEGWCRIDIKGHVGFLREATLWGAGEP